MARNKGKIKLSMPYLELLSLVLAVVTWSTMWSGMKIVFRSDCMPVVQSLNRRSSKIPRSMGLIRHLSTVAALHNFDFRCTHIAGVLNVAADALSRDDLDTFRADQPLANRIQSDTGVIPNLHRL